MKYTSEYERLITQTLQLLKKAQQSSDESSIRRETAEIEAAREALEEKRLDEACSFDQMLLADLAVRTESIFSGLYTKQGNLYSNIAAVGDGLLIETAANALISGKKSIAIGSETFDLVSFKFSLFEKEMTLLLVSDKKDGVQSELQSFSETYTKIINKTTLDLFDMTDGETLLAEWLEDHTEDLYLFYFHFINYYTIFNHFGAHHIDRISNYISERLKKKYPQSLRVYQFSLERYFVFFESSEKDLKTVFTYDTIPIPYTMNKILLKGSNKFDKIQKFLTQEE